MPKGLKIAIGGKGGVGKTTVCAVWSHLFAEDGFNVMAIDADPNVTLASAFGIPSQNSPRPLIEMKEIIAERTGTTKDSPGLYFKMNPKVSDLPEQFWVDLGRIKLLVLGAITQAGAGCACAEGVFLKALLTHTILQRQEVVLVDLAAGVESMGRASIQGIDVLVIVVEPGARSINTAKNIANMAKQLGIETIVAVANKITDPLQTNIIKSELDGITLLAAIPYDPAVQRADINSESVFTTATETTQQLRKAWQQLNKLICSAGQVGH